MKVKDYINDAQNGTRIIIAESCYFEEGDSYSIVFDNVVGEFAKCKYNDCDVSYFRILDNSIELNISKVI